MFKQSSHLTTNHASLTTTNIHCPHLNLQLNTTRKIKYTHTSSKISDYRLRLTCLDSTLQVLQRRNSVLSSQYEFKKSIYWSTDPCLFLLMRPKMGLLFLNAFCNFLGTFESPRLTNTGSSWSSIQLTIYLILGYPVYFLTLPF